MRPKTQAQLRQIAVWYEVAIRLGKPPTQYVADRLGINHAAAAKRIERARQIGELTPTTRGKPSVPLARV